MRDAEDDNGDGAVLDCVEDAIVADPDPVPSRALQGLGSGGSRVNAEGVDGSQDATPEGRFELRTWRAAAAVYSTR